MTEPVAEPKVLAGLDEPVRRYFMHALTDGAPLSRGARLRLGGTIKVGVWLRFDSVWEGNGRGFSWRAICGRGLSRSGRTAPIPSWITAGWGRGTASWAPFFRGEVVALDPVDSTPPCEGR